MIGWEEEFTLGEPVQTKRMPVPVCRRTGEQRLEVVTDASVGSVSIRSDDGSWMEFDLVAEDGGRKVWRER